jgi:hypothetical protein
MPRAEEVLLWAGLKIPGNARLPGDSGISTVCPSCATTQSLSEADFVEGELESVYTCKNGCQPILVVDRSGPGKRRWPGRGYRLGNFVLRNVADLEFTAIDQHGKPVGGVIRVPASPAALGEESDSS